VINLHYINTIKFAHNQEKRFALQIYFSYLIDLTRQAWNENSRKLEEIPGNWGKLKELGEIEGIGGNWGKLGGFREFSAAGQISAAGRIGRIFKGWSNWAIVGGGSDWADFQRMVKLGDCRRRVGRWSNDGRKMVK